MRLLDQNELAAYRALIQSGRLLEQLVDRQLRAEADLSQPQFQILARLYTAPTGIRMTELATGAVTSRSGMTYRVGQLEKRGLMTRRADPADERSVIAELTAEGRDFMDRLFPLHVALVRDSFIGILDRSEVESLATILARVAARLRDQSGDEGE